tara:strand:+ start:2216 stop:2737 length:522 start_codon:yes stop_codon:yes gene_type:complete
MKSILLMSVFLIFISCGNKINLALKKEVNILKENTENHKSEVFVTVSDNSSLIIKEDATGHLYPVIVSGDRIVIEYKYEEKGEEGTIDGDYSETLHFEISKNTKELCLKDDQLTKVKLLFGKHCFCKGEAGYYYINKGKLKVLKLNKEIYFDINFNIEESSSKLKRVSKYLKL